MSGSPNEPNVLTLPSKIRDLLTLCSHVVRDYLDPDRGVILDLPKLWERSQGEQGREDYLDEQSGEDYLSEVTAGFFKNNTGKVWQMAQEKPVTVLRAGKPVAFVLSIQDYQTLRPSAVFWLLGDA